MIANNLAVSHFTTFVMKKIIFYFLLLATFTGFAQTDPAKIQSWLNSNHKKSGLTPEDIKDWTIKSTGSSKATEISNYYVQQRHLGIEIFSAVSNFAVKNGEVIHVGDGFVANVADKANASIPALSVLDALAKAYVLLEVSATANIGIIANPTKNNYKISNGFSEKNPVKARLVYQFFESTLKLAWDFTIHTPDGMHVWGIRIDAATGEMLEKNELMLSCQFELDVHHHKTTAPQTNPFSENFFRSQTATPFQVANSSYRVIPFNYLSPIDHERVLVSNPFHPAASPKGWHDINALTENNPGRQFTTTRGNNVVAVDDWDGDNSDGTLADGTSALLFDFPYAGTGVAATTSINASLTNLFYINNMMHDVWFEYGFDEANGNFQHTNYSGISGGIDEVFAQAQDRGRTAEDGVQVYNNANFYTPVDGETGKMQMYLFNYAVPPVCTVNSPASVAGNYTAFYNSFSIGNVQIPGGAGITADAALGDSGANSGCSSFVNNVTGKIVLLNNMHSCTYVDRVLRMQQLGAVAVIMISSSPENPLRMGGTGDASITIPAISISLTAGNALKLALMNGPVNMTLVGSDIPFVNADSAFDNSIISHEYGHGISTRLTGGANTPDCLLNAEQAGEGWSDWIALMMQLKRGDVGTTPKALANFVLNLENDGPGLRTKPYSTDFAINNLTFNSTNFAAPHQRGEFMAAVLWDLTWAYIGKYGYNDNIYSGNGGNNKVMQLVLDGLKLQPCSPTFVEFRDALFLADNATTNGADFCMIAEVFRKRGMGANATSGSHNSATDQSENFEGLPPGANCLLGIDYFENADLFRVYPNPNNGSVTVSISKFSGKANIQVIDMNGRTVYNTDTDFSFEKTIDIHALQSGMYVLKISGNGLNYSQKIIRK
ncbi:Por secretion system C-terminal sorting domain-containing protein [Flavobacterium noncentrifugens]|uniref:Por secretion system C-terminal sorting domain-containing protein n=2 Tax=Flavobacterium noncentrifugens TaxID=1128970 RepID=A0A1G8SJS0_9FLAO|nr:Por secretion system C-terminal sorting domain-containing protein [Flavobacterium noncentrifugens]